MRAAIDSLALSRLTPWSGFAFRPEWVSLRIDIGSLRADKAPDRPNQGRNVHVDPS